MKTLKNCLSILAILALTSSVAQTVSVDLPSNYIRDNILGNNDLPVDVQGTPYATESFVIGRVSINKDSYSSLLRYNAYLDEIQVKEAEDKIISLLKRDYISAKIGNKTYAIHSYKSGKEAIRRGYFVELNEGATKLILRERKEFVKGQQASSAYKNDTPSRLVDKRAYYLQEGDNPAQLIKLSKKSILPLLKAHQDEASAYVSENKLKLKKEAEIIQLLNYYNNL